jgi:hypothetical protein
MNKKSIYHGEHGDTAENNDKNQSRPSFPNTFVGASFLDFRRVTVSAVVKCFYGAAT